MCQLKKLNLHQMEGKELKSKSSHSNNWNVCQSIISFTASRRHRGRQDEERPFLRPEKFKFWYGWCLYPFSIGTT